MRVHFGNVYITSSLSAEQTRRVRDTLHPELKTTNPGKALAVHLDSKSAIEVISDQVGPAVIITRQNPTSDYSKADKMIRRALDDVGASYVTPFGIPIMTLPGASTPKLSTNNTRTLAAPEPEKGFLGNLLSKTGLRF